MENRNVKGWNFKFIDQGDSKFFQCRGMVMYDEEHDEMPEPSLWLAAVELMSQLIEEGIEAEANFSEKGWVEVTIEQYAIHVSVCVMTYGVMVTQLFLVQPFKVRVLVGQLTLKLNKLCS